MKYKILHFTLFTLLFTFYSLHFTLAQTACTYAVTNKKAEKLFEKGKDKKNTVEERIAFLTQCIELEPEWADAINELAINQYKVYKVRGTNFKTCEENFKKVISLCPDLNPYAYFNLGKYYYEKEQWADAMTYLKKFMKDSENAKNDADYNEADGMLSDAIFYDKMVNHPVPFNPTVVEGVSSGQNEYLAIISPDNEMCMYTRTTDIKDKNQIYASDKQKEIFMYSKRANVNAKFDNGTPFIDPFNVGEEAYGGACVSVDNKKMYITICRPGKAGYTNCDIYTADYVDGSWDNLKNMGPEINTDDGWESQPSISSDGKTLIFATARADSKATDLYVSKKQPDGTWSKAVSVSANINTGGKEKTPFLHSDSQTLYFSSDGNRGVGGFDIYYTRMNDKGEWAKPKNIGYPINTEEDEYGFFVSLDGHLGYFASGNYAKIGRGGIDIFNFDMPGDAKPEKVLFLKGKVLDQDGQAPINGKLELKNLKTKEVQSYDIDRKTGEYAAVVTLKKNEDVIMTIKQEESVPVTTLYTAKDTLLAGKPIQKDIKVESGIQVGKAYKINNINYQTNSAKLTDESLLVLDDLITFLKDNETITIAVNGHTDNVGKPEANLALSTDRAFSIKDYMESKGIDKSRLQFKGYGATKPVATNDTEEGRLLNRRTEFVILSK